MAVTAPVPAKEALARLVEGNRRYVSGGARGARPERRADLVQGQAPFAAVLGCSDSRVPVEAVFDQGLGDLFVVRVAGNIAGPSQLGSLEFAAGQLGVRLVVILGHSRCGAVEAAMSALANTLPPLPDHLDEIVSAIKPGIEPVHVEGAQDDEGARERAVRANVLRGVSRVHNKSEALATLMRDEGLEVVGAVYSLSSGEVEWI